jgi:FtsH-binding integral membrane protein
MNDNSGQYQNRSTVQDMSVDLGLRNFMLGIYQKMALGLLLTAALAYAVSTVPALQEIMFRMTQDGRIAGYTIVGTIISFAPLAILLGSSFLMKNPTAASTGALYWLVVSLIGLSLGAVFLLYTGASLASTFLITAASFAGLSLVGYTTKTDMSSWGKFLIMALIGLIITGLVNAFFLKSTLIHYVYNALGVLIMAGFIAYDTQRLKGLYYDLGGNQAHMAMATNYGALSLYINFVNMFQFLLAFMGVRRD